MSGFTELLILAVFFGLGAIGGVLVQKGASIRLEKEASALRLTYHENIKTIKRLEEELKNARFKPKR